MRNLMELTFRADVSFLDSKKYDDGGHIRAAIANSISGKM
jgi:hypothetical protein